MSASPGAYLKTDDEAPKLEDIKRSVAGSVASRPLVKATVGEFGVVSIGGAGPSVDMFPISMTRPGSPVELGPIFVTTDRHLQALDPSWVAILKSRTDITAMHFMGPGETMALPEQRVLVGAVEDPHDAYLVSYQGPGCVGEVSYCLDGRTFRGWYPLDGHCCCGKRYTTLSSLMLHLVRYFRRTRAERVDIKPRKYRRDGVLHSFEPLGDTPIYAVGDKLDPGSQISSPPNLWVGDNGTIRQSRSSSRGPESQPGCQLAIISDSTLKPRVVQVWNPSNRTIATCGKRQNALNVKLSRLFRLVARTCRACGALPGEACYGRACRGRQHHLKS